MLSLEVNSDQFLSIFFSSITDPHLAIDALKKASAVAVVGSTNRWRTASDLSHMLRATLIHINPDNRPLENFGICGSGNYGPLPPNASTVYYLAEPIKWRLKKQIRKASQRDAIVVTNVMKEDREGWRLLESFGLLPSSRWKLAAEESTISIIHDRMYIGTYDWHEVLAALEET